MWAPNPHPVPPRLPLRATLKTFGVVLASDTPVVVNPDRSGYWPIYGARASQTTKRGVA
jgi:hypothetical protein